MKSLHVFSSGATTIRDVNEETAESAKRYAEYLADEIRAEMGRKKVSNRELARRVAELGEARSEPTISRLLRSSQRMTIEDAWLFAEALGVDLRELMRRVGQRREEEGGPVPEVQRLTPREEASDGEH
jgi:transcriptional regulator with XRE-family HTH domain